MANNWRFAPFIVVGALALWSCSEAVDRQEWVPNSSMWDAMNKARLTKCTDNVTYVTDRRGNIYEVDGTGSEAVNAALNECARANLGPDAPGPSHWKIIAVICGVVIAATWIIPWIQRRVRGDPTADQDG